MLEQINKQKDEMILFGYMDSNSIYTKKEENN